MSGSVQCPHTDLDFDIRVTKMIDSNVGSLRLRASCKTCGARIRLNRGVPMGASSRFPTADAEMHYGGILIPMLADGEEPSKEWGVALSVKQVA